MYSHVWFVCWLKELTMTTRSTAKTMMMAVMGKTPVQAIFFFSEADLDFPEQFD